MVSPFDHQRLDGLLHSRIRLAIMAVLATVDEIDFNTLKSEVNTTDGNLSIHLKKLEDAGYVEIRKQFVNRKPVTSCLITGNGLAALEHYISTVEHFLRSKE